MCVVLFVHWTTMISETLLIFHSVYLYASSNGFAIYTNTEEVKLKENKLFRNFRTRKTEERFRIRYTKCILLQERNDCRRFVFRLFFRSFSLRSVIVVRFFFTVKCVCVDWPLPRSRVFFSFNFLLLLLFWLLMRFCVMLSGRVFT